MKRFSDRLRHIRLLRRYTQAELAQLAGLSQSAVASYESGERKSSRAIFKLAAALRIEAQWLDTGKGPIEHAIEAYSNLTDSNRLRDSSRHRLMETDSSLSYDAANASSSTWPFVNIPRNYYDNLTPRNKQLLEKLMATFLEACYTSDIPPTLKGSSPRRD